MRLRWMWVQSVSGVVVGGSGVLSHVQVALCYPSGPQCVTQTLQLCHYGPPPPAAVPACGLCVRVCESVCVRAGRIGYRTTCLPKPRFNFSGTVYVFYNVIICPNEEHSLDKELYKSSNGVNAALNKDRVRLNGFGGSQNSEISCCNYSKHRHSDPRFVRLAEHVSADQV